MVLVTVVTRGCLTVIGRVSSPSRTVFTYTDKLTTVVYSRGDPD